MKLSYSGLYKRDNLNTVDCTREITRIQWIIRVCGQGTENAVANPGMPIGSGVQFAARAHYNSLVPEKKKAYVAAVACGYWMLQSKGADRTDSKIL